MNNQSQQIVPFKQKVQSVMGLLKAREKQFAIALPKYISVDRWMGVVSRSIQKTPQLLDCTQESFLGAVMQAAQLGLECDGVTGEAYLIPFKNRVTLIPGYNGLLKLVRNTRQLATIATAAVYEDDEFSFEYGINASLKHVPSRTEPTKDPIAYWCAAKLVDGSFQFEVMFDWQVLRIRDRSASYKAAKQFGKSTPWDTDLAEMGRKTVLRRVCKSLPKSTEMARAMRLVDQEEAGEEQDFDFVDVAAEQLSDEPVPAAESKLDKLVELEKAKAAQQEPTKEPPAPKQGPAPAAQPTKAAKGQKTLENPNYAEGGDPDPFGDTSPMDM
jgi:recombination protein RecT